MAAAQASTSGAPQAQEFSVRVPKDVKKTYSIMKFNIGNNVDFTKCGQAKIEKENNYKEFKQAYNIDVMPKFGAGSEYGREQREEARRKKYGIRTRKYNTEDQPWLLKMGTGKTTRKFKGKREGGIADNASYYVFTQCPDGAFEAFPIKEWYNFTSQVKYKALTAEEAEAEFLKRDKNLNLFSIMVKKRITGVDTADDPDEEEGKKSKGKKKKGKDFLLTELDEWAELSDEDGDDDDSDKEDDEDGPEKPKPGKKGAAKKKKKMSKKNSDDEAVEESDDADEAREVDYMTDSESDDEDMYKEKGGDSDEDKYKEQGVEDEDGLRKALNSDEEDEEDEDKDKKEGEENDEEETEKVKEKAKTGSDSDSSSASDSDSDPEKEEGQFSAFFLQKKEKKEKDKEAKISKEKEAKSSKEKTSRSSTPTSNVTDSQEANGKKRSSKPDSDVLPASKKAKMEASSSVSSLSSLGGSSEGITEDSVRRYLMRKPMTTKELLQKFKSKKNIGLTKDQMVTTIAQILKRLNPEKNKIKDKLYLSIKKQE